MSNPRWLDLISPYVRMPTSENPFPIFTGAYRTPPNWVEPLRVIYDHELVMFSEGEFVVELDGRRLACPQGTFLIVPPGKWHVSWDATGKPGQRHWSHFDWLYRGPHGRTPVFTFANDKPQTELYRRAPDFVPRQIFHGPIRRFKRAMETMERLTALQRSSLVLDRLVGRAVLLELLLELLDERYAQKVIGATEQSLGDEARTLLDSNVENLTSIRMEDLLERTGYCYAHVCREFKRRFGISPLKYLHLLCLGRAKLLLRDTDEPVAHIARRLSFTDPEYFSQLFRKNEGLSPSAYRKQCRA